MSKSPIPPKCVGAYTIADGVWRLNPSLGSKSFVINFCDLARFFVFILVADRQYHSLGRSIDQYPCTVSSFEREHLLNTIDRASHFLWNTSACAFWFPSKAICIPSTL
jgi:hypothetical protein